MSGYRVSITVFEGDTRLGATRLERILKVEAPGLASTCRRRTHLGVPVLDLVAYEAYVLRDALGRALAALSACGYTARPDLNAAAERAVSIDANLANRVRALRARR